MAHDVLQNHRTMTATARSELERRAHRRVELTVTIEVGNAAPARAVNLSLGGVGATCEHPPAVGESVRVRATLPGGAMLDTQGEVVWASGSRVGIRFLALDPRTLSALLAALDH